MIKLIDILNEIRPQSGGLTNKTTIELTSDSIRDTDSYLEGWGKMEDIPVSIVMHKIDNILTFYMHVGKPEAIQDVLKFLMDKNIPYEHGDGLSLKIKNWQRYFDIKK